MTDAHKQIEKLLAEGKVSAKEIEHLRRALEKAEHEETKSVHRATRKSEKPRLSRLALAGALAVPAAVVVGLMFAGFAVLVAENLSRSRIFVGVLFVSLAVLTTGLGLSIAGWVSIRRAPDRLRGRWLAHLGIWLSLGMITVCSVILLVSGPLARKEPRTKDTVPSAGSLGEHGHFGMSSTVWDSTSGWGQG